MQSAYHQGHSCETALLRVHNDIMRALGEQKIVVLVLLDLSAAFDTVNHKCLLDTLYHLGVRGTVLQWFATYLCNHQQNVKVKSSM